MKVVGGTARGQRLRGPRPGDRSCRPITDGAKERLFGILGDRVAGRSVLDLFAGTGALGIEALSRGAVRAVFLERAPKACSLIRRNLSNLGLAERGSLARGDALAGARRLARQGETFGLVLADPPFPLLESGAGPELYRALLALARDLLEPEGVLAGRVPARFSLPPPPPGLALETDRAAGEQRLLLFRRDTHYRPDAATGITESGKP